MPIRSGLTRVRRESTRPLSPKPPAILQPQNPEEALAASINAVSGLLHYIPQILAGPMRGSPEFFKQYLRNAAKSAANLLKQLANRTDGLPELDTLVAASVDLLALASEHDPEAAADLAAVLEQHALAVGHAVDTVTAQVLEEARTLSMESVTADVKFERGELWASIEGSGKLVTASGTVAVKLQGLVPVSQLNVELELENRP